MKLIPWKAIALLSALLVGGCGGGAAPDAQPDVVAAAPVAPTAPAADPVPEPAPPAPAPAPAQPAEPAEPEAPHAPDPTAPAPPPDSAPPPDPAPADPGEPSPVPDPDTALDPPPTVTVTDAPTTRMADGLFVAASSPGFRYLGADPGPLPWDDSFQAPAGRASQSLQVSFVTDAARLDLRLRPSAGTWVEVRVDGRPVQPTGLRWEDDSGQARVVELRFPGGPRSRSVEVFGRFLAFGGAWMEPGASLGPPPAQDEKPLLAFAPGDSYTQGNGAASPRQTYAGHAADALGHELWTEGVGGTGWLTGGPNHPVQRVQSTLARLSRPPSIVVTALGYNDRYGDPATVASRYDATVASIRAAWPSARIVTLGPWTPLGTTREIAAMRELLRERAAANGVAFIDLEGIVTPENAQLYTSTDRVHPNAEGHAHLGREIAARLRAAGL